MTFMLVGMQGGLTKFCCFSCLSDSHSTAEHYIRRDWEPKKTYEPGKDSVQHILFVNPMKIFLSPLYINLGLIKRLVKAMANTIQNDSSTRVKNFTKLALQN